MGKTVNHMDLMEKIREIEEQARKPVAAMEKRKRTSPRKKQRYPALRQEIVISDPAKILEMLHESHQ
jgi:hypothetical protein